MSAGGAGRSFAQDLATLAFLDGTVFRHRMRLLVRQPRRLLPWILFLVWMGFAFFSRATAASSGHLRALPDGLGAAASALVPGLYVGLVGLLVHGASRRAPAALSTPADARFLLGSALRPQAVVFWLQLRQAAMLVRAAALNLFVWSVFLLPRTRVSLESVTSAAAALLLAFTLAYALRLPAFVLARRLPRLPLAGFGAVLAAAGFGLVLLQVERAASSTMPLLAGIALQRVRVPLGSLVASAIAGSGPALWLLLGLAAAAIALSSSVARDCYPEIWQASSRAFLLRRRSGGGRRAGLFSNRGPVDSTGALGLPRHRAIAASSSGRSVPAGAMTLLWKEWLQLRRGPGGLGGALLFGLAAVLAGLLVGRFALHLHGYAAGLIVGAAVYPSAIVSTLGGLQLAADLRRPLWWLSQASLTARLLVFTFATSLRLSVLTVLFLAAAALAARASLVLWGIPAALAGLFMLRGIGLAVYAWLPAARDLRGPGNLLRLLLTLVLLVPTAALGGGAGTFFASVPAALFAASVAAALEGWGLVAVAAARLRGNGMAIALEELR